MGAVRMCVQAELHRRWRYVVVLAFVVGLVGTVVLTATAGSRRTSTSFERFVNTTRAQDVLVFFKTLEPATVTELRRLPNVDAVGVVRTLAVTFGNGDFAPVAGPVDDVVLRDVARLRIVAGRPTAPDVPEEIVLGEPLATQRGLDLGDSFVFRSFTQEQIAALVGPVGSPIPEPGGPTIRMHVVGISRLPSDLSQQGASGGIVFTSRAFVEKYGDQIGEYLDAVILVRLADGVDGVPRFVRQLRQVASSGSEIDEVEPTAVSTSGVGESIDVLTAGLVVFAAVALAAGLAALGFAIARLVGLSADDRDTLHALGITRAQRTVVLATPAVLGVVVGGTLALVGAWLASPIMPLGLARDAEPVPGMHFDTLVLVGGSLAIVLVLCGIAAFAAARLAGRHAPPETARASVVGSALESAGAAPPVAIGVRAALESRRGRTAIPARSTLAAVVVAVLGITAVSVFATSLDRLAHTPTLFGVDWDAAVDDSRAERPVADRPCSGVISTRVMRNPAVEDVAGVCTLSIELLGHPIGAFGYTKVRGSIRPTILEGRAPRTANEVALGSATLGTVGRAIGDRVRAEGPAGTASYRVVGRVVLPSLGDPRELQDGAQALADGAVFTDAGLDRLDEPAANLSHGFIMIRFAQGTDRVAATRRMAQLPGVGDPETDGVELAYRPLEVRRLQQVDQLPYALAGFLALLGATAIGYALMTATRRRRGELAVLKTLGFRRRQVSATVLWQSVTVACVGVVVGVPLGVIVGRLVWRAVTDSTGSAFSPDVATILLVVIAGATIASACLVAAVPGHLASRLAPSATLRTE